MSLAVLLLCAGGSAAASLAVLLSVCLVSMVFLALGCRALRWNPFSLRSLAKNLNPFSKEQLSLVEIFEAGIWVAIAFGIFLVVPYFLKGIDTLRE